MTESTILRQAEFDPKVKSYWIWQPVVVLCLLIVTIPIAIAYALIASFFINKYLENMSCTLTDRTLDIKKGILNKTESTIPLEKITDLQLFQGPIMRYFGIHGFKVETAGQSSPTGASLVNMIGIVDTKGFRKAVLDQRDRLGSGARAIAEPIASPAPIGGSDSARSIDILEEIRDSLARIEENITENAG